MFLGLLDLLGCDVCSGGELCEKRVVLTADGQTIRHDDPPTHVVSWPGCPLQWDTSWIVHDWPGGEQTPWAFMDWARARGLHRRSPTAGGALLFREYLRLRTWPRAVGQARAFREAREGVA